MCCLLLLVTPQHPRTVVHPILLAGASSRCVELLTVWLLQNHPRNLLWISCCGAAPLPRRVPSTSKWSARRRGSRALLSLPQKTTEILNQRSRKVVHVIDSVLDIVSAETHCPAIRKGDDSLSTEGVALVQEL